MMIKRILLKYCFENHQRSSAQVEMVNKKNISSVNLHKSTIKCFLEHHKLEFQNSSREFWFFFAMAEIFVLRDLLDETNCHHQRFESISLSLSRSFFIWFD
jgi:hypothetical protein